MACSPVLGWLLKRLPAIWVPNFASQSIYIIVLCLFSFLFPCYDSGAVMCRLSIQIGSLWKGGPVRPLWCTARALECPQDGASPCPGTGDRPAPPVCEALLSVQGASPLHHFLSGRRMSVVALHSSALFSPLSKRGSTSNHRLYTTSSCKKKAYLF